MNDLSEPEIYPRYCFNLAPTFNKWCPLQAAEIQRLKQPLDYKGQEFYFYKNLPIKWVRLSGIVVAIDDFNSRRVFTIDDSSGVCIEGMISGKLSREAQGKPDETNQHGNNGIGQPSWWTTAPSEPKFEFPYNDVDVGVVVDIKGALSTFRDQIQLRIEKMKVLGSTAEELALWEKRCDFQAKILNKPWILSRDALRKCRKEAEQSNLNRQEQQARADKSAKDKRRRLQAYKEKLSKTNNTDVNVSNPLAPDGKSGLPVSMFTPNGGDHQDEVDIVAAAKQRDREKKEAEIRRKKKAMQAYKEARARGEAPGKLLTSGHPDETKSDVSVTQRLKTAHSIDTRMRRDDISLSSHGQRVISPKLKEPKGSITPTAKNLKQNEGTNKVDVVLEKEPERRIRTNSEEEARARKKRLLAYKQGASIPKSGVTMNSLGFTRIDDGVSSEPQNKSIKDERGAERRSKKLAMLAYKARASSRQSEETGGSNT